MLYRKIIFLFLFFSTNAFADFKLDLSLDKYTPHYYSIQTGAYTGFITLGAGYHFFSKRLNTELLAGYVPKQIGGTDIYSMALKNIVHLFQFKLNEHVKYRSYTGLSILYGIDKDLFILLPEKYPKGYYDSTAFRYLLTFGSALEVKRYDRIFIEYSYHDLELTRYLTNENHKQIPWQSLGSLGFGYRRYIK